MISRLTLILRKTIRLGKPLTRLFVLAPGEEQNEDELRSFRSAVGASRTILIATATRRALQAISCRVPVESLRDIY